MTKSLLQDKHPESELQNRKKPISFPKDLLPRSREADSSCSAASYQRSKDSTEPGVICRFGKIITCSRKMQEVLSLAARAARYDSTVLITGECGTGKDMVAKAIHALGIRQEKSFVPVNCAAIPENLLESEFFGYEKGAFTGAQNNRAGIFEEACGGTLFLDEIGELPVYLQVKLLRVLQDREVRPVGTCKTRKVDVRIIAATSTRLAEAIQLGKFRKDLYYRLNVLHLDLPPLRKRPEDIQLLMWHFVRKYSKKFNKNIRIVHPEAICLLKSHMWPGNVRELENVVERAVVMTETDSIHPCILEEGIASGMKNNSSTSIHLTLPAYSLKEAQQEMEKHLIREALVKTEGNKTQAMKLLGISAPTLLRKIREYHLEEKDSQHLIKGST